MFPRSYFPSSYWPGSYWPKTGGEVVVRAGITFGAGTLQQLLIALARREMERSVLDEMDKKRMAREVRELTLQAALRRAQFEAEERHQLQRAAFAAHTILLTEI